VGDDGVRSGEDEALVAIVGPTHEEGGAAVGTPDLDDQGIAITAFPMARLEDDVVADVGLGSFLFRFHDSKCAPGRGPGDPSNDPLSGGPAAPGWGHAP